MNKTLVATVLACAGVFGVAANASARDWGNERKEDHHGYDYRYRDRGYFESHTKLPYSHTPSLHYYVPQPSIETGCRNVGNSSERQYFNPNNNETFYRPSYYRCE